MSEWVVSDLRMEIVILTGNFRCLPQSVKATAGKHIKLGHNRFLLHPIQSCSSGTSVKLYQTIRCHQKAVFFITVIHVQRCHIISTPKNKHLKRSKSIIRSNNHWCHTSNLRPLDTVMHLSPLRLIFHNCVNRTLRNTHCSRQNIIRHRNAQWPAHAISTWSLIIWD
jgi:hypothetical protein